MQNTNTQNFNNTKTEINTINIIAIDGTTASGKGSLARRLAAHYKYNYLNSGALYRLTAYVLKNEEFDFDKYHSLRKERESEIEKHKNNQENNFENGQTSYIEDPTYTDMENKVTKAGEYLSPIFIDKKVIVNDIDVWPIISTQEYGNYAAKISPTLRLREALYMYQRNQIKSPGLVAEGRDMTGVVYSDAACKIYLDASPEERAKRRLKDEALEDSGKHKDYDDVLAEIHDRDTKDKNRHHGALTIVADAYYLDNTNLNMEQTLQKAIECCDSKTKNS